MKKIHIVFACVALSGLVGCAAGESLQTRYIDVGKTPILTKAAALHVLRTNAADAVRQPCDVKDNGIIGYEGHVLPKATHAPDSFDKWHYSVQASSLRRGEGQTVDQAWYAVALRTSGWQKTHHCYVFWRSVPKGTEADRPPEKALQGVVGALRSLGVAGR